jgi:glycosyltransferase involved in cell wall biosynthesis
MAGAALLVSSSRCHEFSPFAVLEALAAGVPVAATRSGGVPELAGEESCVPLGDGAALAARMWALWRDPARREEEGQAALARVRERHSEEAYRGALLGLYDRVLSAG